MLLRRMAGATLAVTLALAACTDEPTTPASIGERLALAASVHHGEPAAFHQQLAALRRATAHFHNFQKAVESGYDVQITPCLEDPDLGGQGFHYGNVALIDGTASLLEPELLLYEPDPAGQMRLVALEYIVPIAAWGGAAPPVLLDQEFHRVDALGIFALHVWLWRHNPSGMFADWNPFVSCEHANGP